MSGWRWRPLSTGAPGGTVPATGVLYLPDTAVEAGPADYDVAAATRLTPATGCAPRLEVAHAVSVLPVKLIRLTAEGGPGGTTDRTDANKRARTSFEPFGAPPAPGAALVATLAGTLPHAISCSRSASRLRAADTADPEDDRLGAVQLFYRRSKGDEIPLRCVLDTSVDMQRSGVMIVQLPRKARIRAATRTKS